MFNPVRKTFQFGGQEVTIETGKVARQATGAVVVTMGDTQVLATGLEESRPIRVRIFSRLPSIIRKRPMRLARSPAVSSSEKVVRPRKKR